MLSQLIDELDSICRNTPNQPTDNIEKLSAILDALCAKAQTLDFESDNRDFQDPPKQNYEDLRKRAAQAFPSFGLYNCAHDIADKVGDTQISIGDALDDLVDIWADLSEVSWRLENTSIEDALFHFQLGYRSHWGRHARDLQLYIHDVFW